VIPPFDPVTGYLPLGVHTATWEEIAARYGYNALRLWLLAGRRHALHSFKVAGCVRVYLNGSFVTQEAEPHDFDVCWEAAGVNPYRLDPVLLDYSEDKAAQKEKFHGEFYPAHWPADPSGISFLEFFQRAENGIPKGIIALDLEGLT
jgi:hypothetical protein